MAHRMGCMARRNMARWRNQMTKNLSLQGSTTYHFHRRREEYLRTNLPESRTVEHSSENIVALMIMSVTHVKSRFYMARYIWKIDLQTRS